MFTYAQRVEIFSSLTEFETFHLDHMNHILNMRINSQVAYVAPPNHLIRLTYLTSATHFPPKY